ncbi:NADH-quinone oxidoreductase subunit J [Halovulum dunhuangense]|uniref:NADH-quinone oxidoreductase subunit J n=1 Tax=Halovulum dunhuangense TaxID=1505036 RepID=A0A849L6S3_9RHOB|nr:NADH-quinone oxidoreductase subunit J [Halovulum dunhuangense]NNU81842.1 NADH-quinone oxidoreductase subunit J [Halovulum dunhuangense]
MGFAAFAFYLFGITTVVSGALVVLSRNPVHSVLWLILAFFSSAGLFVLLGAEFVAMLLVIVYVGAVAVLFLFVVMMLDVDFAELRGELSRYTPIGMLIGLVILLQLGFAFGAWEVTELAQSQRDALTPPIEQTQNTVALGQLIYTRYVFLFQAAGLVLFVAMVGAIVLTLRHREDVKRQDVLAQMYRDPNTAIEMKDVKPGQGI